MSYSKLGDAVVMFVLFLIGLSGLGLVAIIYSIGHLIGWWA